MSEIRFIAVVTVPRTGCTHTMTLLQNCEGLNIKDAIFHKTLVEHMSSTDWAAVKEASSGRAIDNESFCLWRRANPTLALDSLYRSGGNRVLVFKIAPKQLEPEQVERELFSRDDIGFVVLRRRPIEIFISSRKTKVTGAYGQVDTTNITPILEFKPFLRWARRTKAFYDWFDTALERHGRLAIELLYHRDLEDRSNEDALSRIVDKLRFFGIVGLQSPDVVAGKERQDRQPDYRKRFANWLEFESALMAHGKDAALARWALGMAE